MKNNYNNKCCSNKKVFDNLCKDHFIAQFEEKVYKTIKDFNLIKPKDKIVVAVSGGKDSLTVLYLLSQKYKVVALAIDEGIKGYREHTLKDLINFCNKHKIELKTKTVKDEFGMDLDNVIKDLKLKPCSACGVMRRYLLNSLKDFDVLATGHNMDDEAQAIMMNLLKNQTKLNARLGPKTGVVEEAESKKYFVQRMKPLYFCSEKEVLAYTLLKGFNPNFAECPYAKDSFRASVRDLLNDIENTNKGTKLTIITNFLKTLPKLKDKQNKKFIEKINSCEICGEGTSSTICKACALEKQILAFKSSNKQNKSDTIISKSKLAVLN